MALLIYTLFQKPGQTDDPVSESMHGMLMIVSGLQSGCTTPLWRMPA